MVALLDYLLRAKVQKHAFQEEAEEEEAASEAASASTHVSTGSSAHGFFSSDDVRPWIPGRFRLVRKLQDARRNHGEVLLMQDTVEEKLVAVKRVPMEWAGENHLDFVRKHPEESEMIWVDIGCGAYLDSVSFPYACKLLGVYHDEDAERGNIYVVSEFADGHDLFTWCSASDGLPPLGPEREAMVRPVARQIFDGLRRLHDLAIVHGDVSLENLLLDGAGVTAPSQASDHESGGRAIPQVKIIDFGRSSFRSRFRSCCVAKPSYKAPEMCAGHQHDGFLADAFAAGVVLYALLTEDYPWLSTENGADKGFDYYTQHGLRALLARKKPFRCHSRAITAVSDDCIELLEGLLAADPAKRLTLGGGEGVRSVRPSVWESAWLSN